MSSPTTAERTISGTTIGQPTYAPAALYGETSSPVCRGPHFAFVHCGKYGGDEYFRRASYL